MPNFFLATLPCEYTKKQTSAKSQNDKRNSDVAKKTKEDLSLPCCYKIFVRFHSLHFLLIIVLHFPSRNMKTYATRIHKPSCFFLWSFVEFSESIFEDSNFYFSSFAFEGGLHFIHSFARLHIRQIFHSGRWVPHDLHPWKKNAHCVLWSNCKGFSGAFSVLFVIRLQVFCLFVFSDFSVGLFSRTFQ